MTASEASIEQAVADYYSRTLAEHGPSARGVDWPSSESQERRFEVLLESIDWTEAPAVLDYGCGYGALAVHLEQRALDCRYVGYDIAPGMIEQARRVNAVRRSRVFTARAAELEPADHIVASGVFNVKLDTPPPVWERHVHAVLMRLWSLTRQTMSFNLLPPPSAPELSRPHLYYAAPECIVRFCAERLGAAIDLRRDYGLWEFTIHASRPESR